MPFNVTADYLAAVTQKVFFSVLTVALALTGSGCGAEHGPIHRSLPAPRCKVRHRPLPSRVSCGASLLQSCHWKALCASGHTLSVRNSIGHFLSSKRGAGALRLRR